MGGVCRAEFYDGMTDRGGVLCPLERDRGMTSVLLCIVRAMSIQFGYDKV